MLKYRLIFGVLMASAVCGILALDEHLARSGTTTASPGFLFLSFLIGIFGGREFHRITRLTGARPFRVLGVALILLSLLAAWWIGWSGFSHGAAPPPLQQSLLAFSVAAGIGSVFLAQGLRGESANATFNIAATLAGVLYLGVLGGFLILFRFAAGSAWNMVLFLAIVKCTDIGAYFTGRAFGKHKLIHWLSPGKTWEGTLGGLALATLLGLVFGLLLSGEPLHWLPAGPSVLFALPVAAVGQLGDLAKSLLKRDAAIKDSGSAIPGFGGVLDVIDSPLMAAPFAYILWVILSSNCMPGSP